MSPALLELLPATTLPGLTTRRIWQSAELVEPAILLLTVNKLYIRHEPLTLSESDLQKLLIGGNIEEWLGPNVVCVELSQLTQASLHLEELTVEVQQEAIQHKLRFRAANVADDFFAKLARRVQDRFQPELAKVDVLQAMRTPLAAMFGILVVMITTTLLANTYTDLTEYRFLFDVPNTELPAWYGWLDQFFQTIPPRFLGTLSGAALALLQLWAYRRLTHPPQILHLQPKTLTSQTLEASTI
jgi:hypothetical protein